MRAAALMLLAASVVVYRWPLYSDARPDAHAAENRRSFDAWAKAEIAAFAARRTDSRPLSVLLTHAGPVTVVGIELWGVSQRFEFHARDLAFATTLDAVLEVIEGVDLVLAQDEGIRASTGWLPAEALQDEIVAALRDDPRFRLESARADRDGRRMYLFSRHDFVRRPPDLLAPP
jgi:hypothetical protein